MNNNALIGLVKWSVLRHKFYIPMFILIQVVLSMAITYGFLYITNAKDVSEKLHLVSGALVINIIALTCVLAPQIVSEAKQNGIYDYQKTLPVSRIAVLFSDILIWGVLSSPGIVTCMMIAVFSFNITLNISFVSIFSLIFIIFSLLLLGFAIAYFLSPNMMAMITQLIMLGGLLFSPIIYPAERLPNWTEIIYDTLPFVPAANIVRTTLFEIGEYNISNYVVISIWGLLSLISSIWVLSRRK